MYTIQDLKRKFVSSFIWFLIASQIGELFLPHPVLNRCRNCWHFLQVIIRIAY
jgi:hypothetical protein